MTVSRHLELVVVKVEKCDDCPCLYRESEYPASYCKLAKRSWGMGYYRRGDPSPQWCPLRKADAQITFNGGC